MDITLREVEDADPLRSAMVTVVEKDTGPNTRVGGAEAGGRTGTAQHGDNNSEAPYAF